MLYAACKRRASCHSATRITAAHASLVSDEWCMPACVFVCVYLYTRVCVASCGKLGRLFVSSSVHTSRKKLRAFGKQVWPRSRASPWASVEQELGLSGMSPMRLRGWVTSKSWRARVDVQELLWHSCCEYLPRTANHKRLLWSVVNHRLP